MTILRASTLSCTRRGRKEGKRQERRVEPEPASFYPAGSEVRKVCLEGLVRLDGRRVLVGRGVGGQPARVERRDRELAVFYCWKELRRLSHDQFTRDRVL